MSAALRDHATSRQSFPPELPSISPLQMMNPYRSSHTEPQVWYDWTLETYIHYITVSPSSPNLRFGTTRIGNVNLEHSLRVRS